MFNSDVEAMEMLAMELKLQGFYVARQLSMTDVTFQTELVELSDEFIELYDMGAKLVILIFILNNYSLSFECTQRIQN
jgi:hypothetical protein